ncbi:TlpA disulfide reductase family protein [Chitinophaga sp.]|uniref:TlpA disulfide reductase family protein n=1 Tax=Chitinophaga sp. TaxID=1869181 RepID=UPI0031E3C4A1
MIKNATLISLFVLTALAALAQKNVTIEGRIKGLPAGQTVYLSSQVSGSDTDSATTTSGRFSISTRVLPGEGNGYMLQIGRGHNHYNGMYIYLDEGNLHISGNGPGFKDARATGTRAMNDYNSFETEMGKAPQLKGRLELYKRLHASSAKDSVSYKALQYEVQKMREAESAFTLNWVKDHPASPISAYLMTTRLGREVTVAEKETVYNALTESARNNAPARMLETEFRNAKTAVGTIAPLFTQNDTLGKPVNLADFRGKYVLVDFWANWCVPCRAENPNVVEAFKQYQSRNFTVLGVAFERPDEKNKWIKAIHDDELTWTHVSDLRFWDNAAGKLYGIRSIPANVLIGPDGLIVAKNLRGKELFRKLEELLGPAGE